MNEKNEKMAADINMNFDDKNRMEQLPCDEKIEKARTTSRMGQMKLFEA